MKNKHEGRSWRSWVDDEERRGPGFKEKVEAAGVRRQVAEMIYEARVSAHLTQPELARRIRSSQQAVSRIESGAQNVTVELLDRIAKAVGGRFEGRIVYRRGRAA